MTDTMQAFKDHQAKIGSVGASIWLLGWDQETMMPPNGASIRADQLGTLQGILHEMSIAPEVGDMLGELESYAASLDYDSDDAAIIRVAKREFEKRQKVPTDLIVQIYRTAGLAKEAWKKARTADDYSIFEPHLAEMVGFMRQKASYLGQFENPYDALLDDFEPDLNYEYINGVFSDLKPRLKELVAAIAANQDAVDASIIRREVSAEKQMAFGEFITDAIGYDYQSGRLDKSAHPFTSGTGPGDIRITTRVALDNPISNVMACLHEAGHGMHGQNLDKDFSRYPAGRFSTLAIAESQSRLYENIIGRSLPFWKRFYPDLQKHFTPTFDDLPLEDYWRAVNASRPSLNRVEADEVTYGMHIMIRFEIENDLINERIEVADLPEIWNATMDEYLGVVPTSDAEGVLQDIHWSQGGFGYFPDYLLGSIYASQLWDKLSEEMPDVDAKVEAGEMAPILTWMRESVMIHGRKFTFPELTERTVGGFSADPYMNYLTNKYTEVYGL